MKNILYRLYFKAYLWLRKKLGQEQKKFDRGEILMGFTLRARTSCGQVLVTINHDKFNNVREVFFNDGSKGCRGSQQGIGRLASLALRYNIPAEEVINQLSKVRCPNATHRQGEIKNDHNMGIEEKSEYVSSCAGVAAKALKKFYKLPEKDEKEKKTSQQN